MAMLNLTLPNFNESDLSDEKQRRRIMNYLVKLDEQLRFVLSNLDEENVTETFRTEIIKAASGSTTRETVSIKEIQSELGRLRTEISQAYDAIELKASAEELNALGQTVENVEAKVNVQAGEISLRVTQETYDAGIDAANTAAGQAKDAADAAQTTANGAVEQVGTLTKRVEVTESTIEQQAGEIELRVKQTVYEDGIAGVQQSAANAQSTANTANTAAGEAKAAADGKLGKNDPSVGVVTSNGIVIDTTGVHIEGGVIEMNTTEGEEYVHIKSDGIAASSLTAPNVMPRYAGPGVIYVDPAATEDQIEEGNYVRSLQDALDRVNGRQVPYNVYVQMKAGMTAYEEITLRGAYFAAGFAILGDSEEHAKIVGRLNVRHCVGYVKVQYVDVNAQSGSSGMYFLGNGVFGHILDCVITGMGVLNNSNSRCIEASDGAKIYVQDCGLYDSEYAVMTFALSQAFLKNNRGNCRYGVDASLVYASGTAPCDESEFRWTYWNAGELRNGVSGVDQGDKPTVEALPQVGRYGMSASGHYSTEDGWDYFDSRDVYQGYTKNAKELIGCMWFNDMSGLKGKEILQANLRLTRMSGIGRSSAVSVSLAALTSSVGEAPVLGAEYGVIGSFEQGLTTTVTIPSAAVEALAGGTIRGLALYTGETAVYKERSYSKNYARFAGQTSGTEETKPEIAVIYR